MSVNTESQIEYTSIRVSIDTRKRLNELGNKNDSYDDIIKRLLELQDKMDSQ
jgi:predicted CopG family antitoxin